MTWEIWLRIIAEILRLIAEGISRQEAAGIVGAAFGVSAEEILRRGGL